MRHSTPMQSRPSRFDKLARSRRGSHFRDAVWLGVVLIVADCSGSDDSTETIGAGGSGASAGAPASSGGSGSTACNICTTAADCGSGMRCIGFDFPVWADQGYEENWALRCAYTTKSTKCCRHSGNSSQCVTLTVYSDGDPEPGATGGASGQAAAGGTEFATSSGGATAWVDN
jgi:hypothetical protein